jgi:hypothetical protein
METKHESRNSPGSALMRDNILCNQSRHYLSKIPLFCIQRELR